VLFHEELPLLHASINITRIIISQYLNSSSISAPNPNSGYQAGISPAPIPSLAINTQTIKIEKFEIQISNLPALLPSNFQRKKKFIVENSMSMCHPHLPNPGTYHMAVNSAQIPHTHLFKLKKIWIPNEYQYQISPRPHKISTTLPTPSLLS
jgi:hypothetical protein